MKKYVIAYSILFLIFLGLGLAHGIPFGITYFEMDWSHAFHPVISRNIFLIYNIIIMLVCFVIAIILTSQKKNNIKYKWLIPVIMLICFAFLPVAMSETIRWMPTEHTKEFWSVWSVALSIMHNHEDEIIQPLIIGQEFWRRSFAI